jgi:hypothetical protein
MSARLESPRSQGGSACSPISSCSALLCPAQRVARPPRSRGGEPRAPSAARGAHPPKAPPTPDVNGPLVLVLPLVTLVALAVDARPRPARYGHPLAPVRLATLLDVEKPAGACRSAAYPAGSPRLDPADGQGEPTLGQHPHPGRAPQARLRGQRSVRAAIPAIGPASPSVAALGHLLAQPRASHLGGRLVGRQNSIRLG